MRYWISVVVLALLISPLVMVNEPTTDAHAASVDTLAPKPQTSAPVRERVRKRLHKSLKRRGPWNVVLVLTDDQPKGMLDAMPAVRNRLAARGVTYSNAFIPTSVCCPSRASLLTGELAAQTGVYTNRDDPNIGGYRAFKRNGNERRTFAVALKKAGYHTGYFGKYLNNYRPYYRGRKPPGWHQWSAFVTRSSGRYRNFRISTPYSKRDRRRISNGKRPRSKSTKRVKGYSTTYLGRQAARFIRNTPRSKPVLTVLAPYAPHSAYRASAKYRNSLRDNGLWRLDPSVDEADVSDKPRWIRQRASSSWPTRWLARDPSVHTLQRQTLRSVDDEVRRLIRTLRKTKRLDKTLFMFVSDNGYSHGQHRIISKYTPHRASTEVPLVVRYGKLLRSAREDRRVTAANIDLTATILRAAGLRERVRGKPLTGSRPRSGVPLTGVKYVNHPPYCGWRTAKEMYVRYGSGEEEYYDYRRDPYELENRINDKSAANAISTLRRRAARACRPTPPGYGSTFDRPTWQYEEPEPSESATASTSVTTLPTPSEENPVPPSSSATETTAPTAEVGSPSTSTEPTPSDSVSIEP